MEQLREDMRAIYERLRVIEVHQAKLSQMIEAELASRDWVRESIESALKPVTNALSNLAKDTSELTKLSEQTFAAQQQLMKDRADREQQEHDARIAALERSSWKNVTRRAWFWIVAIIGVPVMLAGSVKAVQDLAGYLGWKF